MSPILMIFLIFFPLLPAVFLLIVKSELRRKWIVLIPVALIAAASLVLAVKGVRAGPLYFSVAPRDGGTWEVDRLKCVICVICGENCPRRALSLRAGYTPPATGEKKELFRVTLPAPKTE